MIRYIPMTDEQLEDAIERRIKDAIDALNELSDDSIPSGVLRALESTVESYDWTGIVLNDDYNQYLDEVDSVRDAMGDEL